MGPIKTPLVASAAAVVLVLVLAMLANASTPSTAYAPLVTSIEQPTATATRPASCDPSYPTVCIPPPPPDLDCPEIPYTNFTVLPPDPHRLDGDKDGIGCESD